MMRKNFLSVLFVISLLNSPVFAAVDFDGTDDLLCGENQTTGMPTQHPLTITAWIYPNDVGKVGSQGIFEFGGDAVIGKGFFFKLQSSTNDINYITHDVQNYQCTDCAVVNNEWQFVAVTVDVSDDAILYHYRPSTATLTTQAITYTSDMTAPDSNSDIRIGGRFGSGDPVCTSSNQYFDGQITEVHVYSTNLSAAQLEKMYLSQLKRLVIDQTNCAAAFYLDDQPDGTSADADTFRDFCNNNVLTGDDGAGNANLTATAESFLSYQ